MVRLGSARAEEHIQRYSLALGVDVTYRERVEASFIARIKLGVAADLGALYEQLEPRLGGGPDMWRPSVAVGPSLAVRLLGSDRTRIRLDMRYRMLFILAPTADEVGVGRAHVFGPTVFWAL
ncbi:MAG: hypothetical protein R3B70_25935 [Polyangiaceae bacterium]